ncbi:MAG: ribonuclease H-like domain-containing protein [Candidatus Limnocylindria bacterium]
MDDSVAVVVLERSVGLPASVAESLPRSEDARYFDSETTGLSTGSGTVLFLAAVGRVDDDRLIVRQYLLADYPGERALLELVASDLAGGRRVVSYNGRAFDMPLLRGRLALHGMHAATAALPAAHDDLLHPARRLWRRALGSVRLAEVERAVLRVRRMSECASWEIPGRFFAYLNGAPADILREVVDHNAQDVASLVLLQAELARLRTGGWRAAALVDPRGMALELMGVGAASDALEILEAAVDGCSDDDEAARLRRLAARLLVTSGQPDRAEALWRAATGHATVDSATSWIEIARLRERYRGDLAGALEAAHAASRALDLALALGRGGGITQIGRARLLVERRRRRLSRRLAVANRRAERAARHVA